MSGANSVRRSGSRAFTLVEVLAALLFLAIAIPAILGAISASGRASETAERSTIAAQLAENQLGQAVIDATNTSGGSSAGDRGEFGADYPGYRWELKQESWPVYGDLTQYTMQVFYMVKGQEQSVALTTLLDLNSTNPQ